MSIRAGEIVEYLRSLSPAGVLGPEEGLIHGARERATDTVLVAWMPTVAAIRRATGAGCHVIVGHEALTFHDYFPKGADPNPWTADRARLTLLDKNGITVIRAHSTVDPTHVVPGFIRAVGLSSPIRQGSVWSLHQETPIRVADLASRAADGLGMDTLRVTGDPGRVVSRVGVMVGGLGLDRHLYQWEGRLMGWGVDVVLAGETNDFAQRFAMDSGLALIETCHSASEEPGLQDLARDMREALRPHAEVLFHKEVIPWSTV